MKTATRIEAGNKTCEDRVHVFELGPATCIALADGAGGVSGGARAAQLFIDLARQSLIGRESLGSLFDIFMRISREIELDEKAGETTGIIVAVLDGQVMGASAGDSEAWLFSPNSMVNLTARQAKSRRLGTAEVAPVTFGPNACAGTLVVASDGLWKYTTIERIAAIALGSEVDAVARQLIDAVRLRSGQLQDDVAVAIC